MNLKDFIILENTIALAAIIAAGTAIIIFVGRAIKFFKKTIHFFDDFMGEEERPGVERRPGVSERISKMEKCLSSVDSKFKTIEYKIESIEQELQPNSGSSLRDAVTRIEDRIEVIESGRK